MGQAYQQPFPQQQGYGYDREHPHMMQPGFMLANTERRVFEAHRASDAIVQQAEAVAAQRIAFESQAAFRSPTTSLGRSTNQAMANTFRPSEPIVAAQIRGADSSLKMMEIQELRQERSQTRQDRYDPARAERDARLAVAEQYYKSSRTRGQAASPMGRRSFRPSATLDEPEVSALVQKYANGRRAMASVHDSMA